MSNRKNASDSSGKRNSYGWIIRIFIITLLLSAALSFISEVSLSAAEVYIAVIVLFIFISIGVFFDCIGVAIASASLTPFISMSSKRIKGADESVYLLKRANVAANICNDVIGDICGIVSGTAGAALTLAIRGKAGNTNMVITGVVISALIAALTVGGKAVGKQIALKDGKDIVLAVGRFMHLIKILPVKDK